MARCKIIGQQRVMLNKIVNIIRTPTITKFGTIVPYICMIMCTNFGKKRTTFAEITLKSRMYPSSRTRARGRPQEGRGSMNNRIITKFGTVVPYDYMRTCPDFGKKTSTFAEVTQQSVEHSYNTRT